MPDADQSPEELSSLPLTNYPEDPMVFDPPEDTILTQMKQIGNDGYNPTSVAEWLDSIELGDYTKSFLINGYTSMDLVKKIWESELVNMFYTCIMPVEFNGYCMNIPEDSLEADVQILALNVTFF
ncbi:Ankyrin repeat and sterile alpha motif domain-containing protein 1B [Chelonia mydas]|uniref:Ankyrin repeat and sterile alpha motif domain-containing protein 1B n=1 Tax=Chelonia mydas TaxID=8469 RepID=M7ANU0_CHEMY|nr:Ankyrin repeat and sterile alpha motif domain-containing protein 1B [Chelonia mydas]